MGVSISPNSRSNIHSPADSVLSPSSEGTLSVCSGVTSPSGASSGILEVEHTDTDDDLNPYAESQSGFLGYYSSLEMSAAKQAEQETEALLQESSKDSPKKTTQEEETKQQR